MKKHLLRAALCLALLAAGAGAWLFGYHNRKNLDNIPSRELLVTYLLEKGESYATEKIEGYSVENLTTVWGDPDGELFGMYGYVWESGEHFFIVYFDSDGLATHVKLRTT